MSFNQLKFSEAERLALLMEELGEAQQAIGKILRHGYASYNPNVSGGMDNRMSLECELGDVKAAIELMVQNEDVDLDSIDEAMRSKLQKVNRYLHHNKVKP